MTEILINNETKNKKNSIITSQEQKYFSLIQNFKSQTLSQNSIEYDDDKELSKASNENIIDAFIKSIAKFIGDDEVDKTLQGLNISIKKASEYLFNIISQENLISEGRSTITLKAVSEILLHMINKHISKNLREDFNIIKNSVVKLCDDLLVLNQNSKKKISSHFKGSVRSGMTILVHGFSTTVYYSLLECQNNGVMVNVLITDCSPEHSGKKMKEALDEEGIKCDIISDLSVGFHMSSIDVVLVGCNAIVENGGIINRMGTYTLAVVAKNFKKPFYVLSESLKFLKLYPLEQTDIPFNKKIMKDDNANNFIETKGIEFICDYTPPEFISLIFTDNGIFIPSALSDKIIQMFYN